MYMYRMHALGKGDFIMHLQNNTDSGQPGRTAWPDQSQIFFLLANLVHVRETY